jgi:hypothetical protein
MFIAGHLGSSEHSPSKLLFDCIVRVEAPSLLSPALYLYSSLCLLKQFPILLLPRLSKDPGVDHVRHKSPKNR